MAKKNKTEGDEAKSGKGGKGKTLALYALAALGVLGGLKGFVLGGDKPAAADAVGASTTTTTKPGPIVTLAPITVNITGDRFLKVGLGLQLWGKPAGAGHTAPDSDDPTKGYARALDLTIETFGGHTYEELSTPEGRRKAKEELVEKLKEAYHEEVEGVYFTEFVMQ